MQYTTHWAIHSLPNCCFIRISKILLYAIHNSRLSAGTSAGLFYQDFKDTFVCNTQHTCRALLVDFVVLSGCQWTIWRIYTTPLKSGANAVGLFYQDVNEQFEGYTQRTAANSSIKVVVLSGCQWTIWRIYTTLGSTIQRSRTLFYQDVNEQIWRIYTTKRILCHLFCWLFYQDVNEQIWRIYTTIVVWHIGHVCCCIRMSMNKFSAKVQKNHEIYKFSGKILHISKKSSTFAATLFEGYTQ